MLSFVSDASLGKFCTFLTGGKAERIYFAYSPEELAEAASRGAVVIGRGSNILVGDCGYRGEAVINRADKFAFGDGTCICDSGTPVARLCREYELRGMTGLEWAAGIPGTVGGAVVGNAGAFGGSISDIAESVTVYCDGRVTALTAKECSFGYRHSGIRGAVLSVKLKARKGDKEKVAAEGARNLAQRRATQPGGASAGSIFKAAGDVPAGVLIDRAGLKGLSSGGARISEKHANFIVNRGGAASGDILYLMNVARAAVYDKFGVKLEREIKLLGDFF